MLELTQQNSKDPTRKPIQDATIEDAFEYEEKRLIKKTIDEPVEHINMLDEIEEL